MNPSGTLHRHPAFAPLRHSVRPEALETADSPEALGALVRSTGCIPRNGAGAPLAIVPHLGGSAADYERRVHERAELGVQAQSWHDRFNVAAWCLFPKSKAVISARHVGEFERQRGTVRTRVRDALTLFDEDGIVVAASDPDLVRLVREFRWKELFVERRAALARDASFVLFGHALMEKMLHPFVGLTGKALFVALPPALAAAGWDDRLAALDEDVARQLAEIREPGPLSPLPVLGIPGWFAANEDPAFYDDVSYFRPGRTRRAGPRG